MAKGKYPTPYTACDGELVRTLEVAEEGGYVVTSPMDPETITRADSPEAAFEMARNVIGLLNKVRAHELRAGRAKRPAAGRR